MMNSETQIPCPVCKTKIHFDIKQLLLGGQISCSNCLTNIGLATGSKEEVKGALDKLKELRGD